MTLDDIRLFTEVVAHGSISVAARRNNLSQQTLSRRIINLEHEVGHTLFERTTPIKLTPAGNAYLNYAYEVISLTAAVNAEMRACSSQGSDSVRIKRYVTDSFFSLMTGVTEALRTTHPNIRLDLISKNDDDCELVGSGTLDIGFVRDICPPDERPFWESGSGEHTDRADGLAFVALSSNSFDLKLGVLERHPLLSRPAVTLADVAAFQIATPSFESNGAIPRSFARLFERLGLTLRIDMVVSHSMLEYYALARPSSVYVFNETYSAATLSTHRRRIEPLKLADGPYTVHAAAVFDRRNAGDAVNIVIAELSRVDAEL